MLFSSLEFLYLFLPLTVTVYFLCPAAAKNAVLLVSSLIFYAWGESKYLFLMLVTVTVNYALGLLISKCRLRRLWLVTAVVFDVGLLVFFKYYSPLSKSISFLPFFDIALPIGISFYTFQALSYVVDVYRTEVAAQRSLMKFSTYVALFPQLVAGPIVRYSDVDSALETREHSFGKAAEGIRLFSAGLAKKVLLANSAGEMFERLSALDTEFVTVASAWLGLVFYAFQIYFDFSGYSDMARGLGKIFGFEFPENFNYPYISQSVSEFWRRWHITLSSFFREYVYIPLGGNRRGRARTYLNLLVVWTLTGIWHGASINFLLWGLYYFILLVAEKAFFGRLLERLPAFLRYAYTVPAILVGWLIFASDSAGLGIEGGIRYFGSLFGAGGIAFANKFFLYELLRNAVLLTVMVLACTPVPKKIFFHIINKKESRVCVPNALCFVCLFLCTAYLVSSGYNPFLYFRF